MVSRMPNQPAVLPREFGFDRVFKALADPTRLAVVERLGRGPAATSELADEFDMALPSFLQHLKVLEESGLVASHKQGRVRTYRLTPDPLRQAEHWLSEQRDVWECRLDRLDEHLYEMKKEIP
jgi:DNA-binding transcriptional ArsR family regulator